MSIFCHKGTEEARHDLFDTVREYIAPETVEYVKQCFDTVFDDCVEEAEDIAQHWAENFDSGYSTDDVTDMIENLQADEVPDAVRDDVIEKYGGLTCPTCTKGRPRPELAGVLTCSSCRREFVLVLNVPAGAV